VDEGQVLNDFCVRHNLDHLEFVELLFDSLVVRNLVFNSFVNATMSMELSVVEILDKVFLS
jgi:hypothetical protein